MRKLVVLAGIVFLAASCGPLVQEVPGEAKVIYPYFRDGNFPRIAIEVTSLVVTVYSPVGGRVTIFSLDHGGIRALPEGKIFVTLQIGSADGDRRQFLVLNLGALDEDIVLLVKQGQEVEAGEALFKIVGLGPSQDFYFFEGTPPYQVIGFATDEDQGGLELSGEQIQILLEGRS